MKAPFPWFGGKRLVAAQVWERLGADAAVYAEPFAGSLAVLLGRPGWHPDVRWVETVNDLDGFVCNAWRAILHDPEHTATHADWPVNENDLHARHAWLVEQRESLVRRLEGDPDFYDPLIAGWWLWGIACWIGGGFCSGDGPWHRSNGELLQLGIAGRGVNRQLVHLGTAGQGVNRQHDGLLDWLQKLSNRIRNVRVCSGDWARILTHSALAPGIPGRRAIFLDPPYSADTGREMRVYAHDSADVAHHVRAWCLAAPEEYRIALCGYEGEGHDDELAEAGWSMIGWGAQGGFGHGNGNEKRERVWFSPACVGRQEALF